MSVPTVEAAINELMDWEWPAVEEVLAKRGLLGDGLVVEDYTGLTSWLDRATRHTIVHSAMGGYPLRRHDAGGRHPLPPRPPRI